MAANPETTDKAANGESQRHILRRRLTEQRADDERERIHDLATEVCQWLSQRLDVEITPENFADKLNSGVELCKLQNKLVAVAGGDEAKISYNANAKSKSMHAQENITHFIEWCKGFIHSDEVFESNDLVDHKSERKCQMRVLSCLQKVKQKYSSVPESIKKVPETHVTDTPNLISEHEGNNEEEKQEVASSIQEPPSNHHGDELNQPSTKPITSDEGPQKEQSGEKKEGETTGSSVPEPDAGPASTDDAGQSNPQATKPASIEGPQEEESEGEKEGKTRHVDNSAPEPNDAHAPASNNQEIRSRPSKRNKHPSEEPGQNEDKKVSGSRNPTRNESNTLCRYLYPLVVLGIISLVILGGLYILQK